MYDLVRLVKWDNLGIHSQNEPPTLQNPDKWVADVYEIGYNVIELHIKVMANNKISNC